MRVLAPLAIVAGAAAATAVACYSPAIADCQFACATSGTPCPSGFTCTAGLCRSGSGSCPAGTLDAPVMCPAVPNNCGSSVVVGDICMAACTGPANVQLNFNGAQLACQGAAGWHLATLDTPERLRNAPTNTPPNWVGAKRAGSAQPFVWLQTGSNVPASEIQLNTSGDCLAVTATGTLTNDGCSVTTGSNALHRFVCDTHP